MVKISNMFVKEV